MTWSIANTQTDRAVRVTFPKHWRMLRRSLLVELSDCATAEPFVDRAGIGRER